MSEELGQLEAEAVAVDAVIAPPNPEAEQAAQAEAEQAAQDAQNAVTQEAEIVGLLTITAALFTPMFPSLEKIYTPQTIQSIASATVPVMQKHGWNTGELLGKYGEEIALAVVVLPVGFASWQAIRHDIAEAERKKAEEEKAAKLEEEKQQVIIQPPQDFEPIIAARG